jgi:cation transport ATPase
MIMTVTIRMVAIIWNTRAIKRFMTMAITVIMATPTMTIMFLGHWIEIRSVMSASAALEKLAELLPCNAHRGIILSPAVGAVLMSLSTVIVAINARFLKLES